MANNPPVAALTQFSTCHPGENVANIPGSTKHSRAGMVELVDAVDSKSTGGNTLRVRFSLPVPVISRAYVIRKPFFIFVNENSPLSGEFQKGEAYTYPQKALLCLERSCPDFSQTSKGEQQWKSRV